MEAYEKEFCMKYLKKIQETEIETVQLFGCSPKQTGAWIINFKDGTGCSIPRVYWEEFEPVRSLIESKLGKKPV